MKNIKAIALLEEYPKIEKRIDKLLGDIDDIIAKRDNDAYPKPLCDVTGIHGTDTSDPTYKAALLRDSEYLLDIHEIETEIDELRERKRLIKEWVLTAGLKVDEKSIIELAYYKEMTVSEIASTLFSSNRTVNRKKKAALDKLSNHYGVYEKVLQIS